LPITEDFVSLAPPLTAMKRPPPYWYSLTFAANVLRAITVLPAPPVIPSPPPYP